MINKNSIVGCAGKRGEDLRNCEAVQKRANVIEAAYFMKTKEEVTEAGCSLQRAFADEQSLFEELITKAGYQELYYDAPYYWGVINPMRNKILTYTEGDMVLISCSDKEKLRKDAEAHIEFLKTQGYGKSVYGEWDDVKKSLNRIDDIESAKKERDFLEAEINFTEDLLKEKRENLKNMKNIIRYTK